jgi:8-oxo-dGTP pyrophosphatase MutT (NUDIX family)
MARHEQSAGVVLFREDRHAPGGRLFLLLDYGRHWDYPKGHLENGESPQQAALRELREETGIDRVELDPSFSRQVTYYFRHPKRGLVRKTVTFFLGRTDQDKVTLSDEHVAYAFLPFDEALGRLTYASARRVLRSAAEHMAK